MKMKMLSRTLILAGAALASADGFAQEAPVGAVTAGPLRFEERLLRDQYGYAYGIAAADLDGDGDLDLNRSDTAADQLLWFENAGGGQFKERRIQEKDPGWFERHAVGDINGDQRPDVVVVKNHVAWYENVGRPGRGAVWKKHRIGDLVGAFEAVAGDLDGDGDLDVAATGWGAPGQVAWFENRGAAADWRRHTIKSNWSRANSIILADLDGDGRLDLAATAERGANEFRWWRNVGAAEPD